LSLAPDDRRSGWRETNLVRRLRRRWRRELAIVWVFWEGVLREGVLREGIFWEGVLREGIFWERVLWEWIWVFCGLGLAVKRAYAWYYDPKAC
jgi:hypothetical protein